MHRVVTLDSITDMSSPTQNQVDIGVFDMTEFLDGVDEKPESVGLLESSCDNARLLIRRMHQTNAHMFQF